MSRGPVVGEGNEDDAAVVPEIHRIPAGAEPPRFVERGAVPGRFAFDGRRWVELAQGVTALAQPTQTVHPWRSTLRTVLQLVAGLAVAIPIFVTESGLDPTAPFIGTVLGVAAAASRIMAIPGVEAVLARYLPPIAAAPRKEIG